MRTLKLDPGYLVGVFVPCVQCTWSYIVIMCCIITLFRDCGGNQTSSFNPSCYWVAANCVILHIRNVLKVASASLIRIHLAPLLRVSFVDKTEYKMYPMKTCQGYRKEVSRSDVFFLLMFKVSIGSHSKHITTRPEVMEADKPKQAKVASPRSAKTSEWKTYHRVVECADSSMVKYSSVLSLGPKSWLQSLFRLCMFWRFSLRGSEKCTTLWKQSMFLLIKCNKSAY